MLVFIDECGDPGFRVDKGSSPVFVAAMVIFQNGSDADATNRVIQRAQERLKIGPEFKFNKTSDRNKEEFFQAVYQCPFLVRALVVEKKAVRSVHLRESKEDFYRYFVRMMMTYDDGRLDGAEVIIDGSGAREFKKELKSYLRRQLGSRIKGVRLSDSQSDPLVQLADMCAGAIGRSYRTDRQDAWRWRTMIGRRIDDVWEFG